MNRAEQTLYKQVPMSLHRYTTHNKPYEDKVTPCTLTRNTQYIYKQYIQI